MIQRFNKFYADFRSIITNIINKLSQEQPFEKLLTLVGGLIAIYKLGGFGRRILYNISITPKSLESIYGNGSWAVVTGPTSGLGYHFARYLAKRGFSICLIGRDINRLSQLEIELKRINPGISTKFINLDFSKSTILGLWISLRKELEDLDVSILINNVGIGCSSFFSEGSNDSIKDAISINCLGMVNITQILLSKLQQRNHRSAIINVSCSEGLLPVPFISLYSSTKAFVHKFTQSLQAEQYKNIDILSYTPFRVDTNLSLKSSRYLKVSPEYCVQSCFRVLGKYPTSAGPIIHRLIVYFRSWFPSLLTNYTYSTKKERIYQSSSLAEKRFEARLQNMEEDEEGDH